MRLLLISIFLIFLSGFILAVPSRKCRRKPTVKPVEDSGDFVKETPGVKPDGRPGGKSSHYHQPIIHVVIESDKKKHHPSESVMDPSTINKPTDYTPHGNCWRVDDRGFSRWRVHCDFHGRDLKNFETNNLGDCRNGCRNNEECTHFTYNYVRNICFLKRSTSNFQEKPSENGFCGFIPHRINVSIEISAYAADYARSRNCWSTDNGQTHWGAYCDFHGEDIIERFPTNSLTECRIACIANAKCTNFAYNYVHNVCFVKWSTTTLIEKYTDSSFCGFIEGRSADTVKPTVKSMDPITEGIQVTKPTVKPIEPITEKIQVTKPTVKPTKKKVATGKCWSEDDQPSSSRFTHWNKLCDFNGRDITSFKTSDLTECRIGCSDNQMCTHFVFNFKLSVCYLKRSTTTFKSNKAKFANCGFIVDPNGSFPKC